MQLLYQTSYITLPCAIDVFFFIDLHPGTSIACNGSLIGLLCKSCSGNLLSSFLLGYTSIKGSINAQEECFVPKLTYIVLLCIIVTIVKDDGMCRICQNNKSFIKKTKQNKKTGISLQCTPIELLHGSQSRPILFINQMP